MTTNVLNSRLTKLLHQMSLHFKKVDKRSVRILLLSIVFGITAIIMIFLTMDNRQNYSNSMGSIAPTKNIEDKSIRFFNR